MAAPVLALSLVGGVGVGLTSSAASAATAVTLYVATPGTSTSCTSPGTGACPTLQDAINAAEQASYDGDDVTIEVRPGTYAGNDSLDAQSLGSLTIAGSSSTTTTLESDESNVGVLQITSGVVTITGLTITDGTYPGGGGIQSDGSTLTLTHDVFSGDSSTKNAASSGGALAVYLGALIATDDRFSNDSASSGGGAIATGTEPATISGDTFTHNFLDSSGSGGAIYNTNNVGNYVTAISDDTFFENNAFYGSGVANYGTVTLTNDTLLQDGPGYGTGIANEDGTARLTNDSIMDTIWTYSTSATTVSNSIVTGTCNMAITDGGYNIVDIEPDTCGLGPTSRLPHRAVDMAYYPARNGAGFPKTLALGPNSPAIDEVPASACTVTTDERGRPRPGISGQTSCDAGAYELQHTPTTLVQNAKTSATVDAGHRYVGQLETTHATGDVSYTVTASSPRVTVSTGGVVRVPDSTPPGTYKVSGTDRDPVDDTGDWAFTATVKRAPR